MSERQVLQRKTSLAAAVLMIISLLTGIFVSAAMTGKVNADAHSALASHLNALLGSLWVIAVGFTLPFLRYSVVGCRRLVVLTVVSNVSNWLITAIKAFWHVAGVDATGEGRNDTIFGLLTAFVVLPSLAAAVAWAYGLSGSPPAGQS